MKIEKVRSEGIAALSYFVTSKNKAFVVDPRRDVEVYLSLAQKHDSEIRYILETHRNEDFIIGSLELQSYIPTSRIGHSNATKFGYGDDNIADEEVLQIGDMRIRCIQTPGHTDDSIIYAISDTSVSTDPLVAFTGDTLFVNEVGRIDLVAPDRTEKMARTLFESLHEKLVPLGDGVIIHPGHGAGSVCGGAIGEREFSTIEYEMKHNPWLNLDEEEFVEGKLRQNLTRATYFKNCERLNTTGPPLISELPSPKLLDVASFEELMRLPNRIVIDTRPAYVFRQFYIPDSISMDLDHMGLFAGWVLKPESHFLFILHDNSDISRARAIFLRLGLDNIIGYLGSGIDSWVKTNRNTRSMKQYSLVELKDGLENDTVRLVDVRQPHEFDKKRIPKSESFPLTEISEQNFQDGKPIVTMCPVGVRSTTGASIMLRNGFKNVLVPLEGLKTWEDRGYPLEQ